MKKIIIISLALIMVLALVAGCGGGKVEVVGDTQTGLGTVIKISSSTSATVKDDEPVNGRAQADVIMASVTIDEEGKIISVSIDTAQVRVAFDNEGQLVTDLNAELKTKVELGDDYGMKARSDIGKEWYEQIASLEQWMVGKTIAEVKAMKTFEKDPTHLFVPDEADLKTSVTITVESYIKAVEKAVANAK